MDNNNIRELFKQRIDIAVFGLHVNNDYNAELGGSKAFAIVVFYSSNEDATIIPGL